MMGYFALQLVAHVDLLFHNRVIPLLTPYIHKSHYLYLIASHPVHHQPAASVHADSSFTTRHTHHYFNVHIMSNCGLYQPASTADPDTSLEDAEAQYVALYAIVKRLLVIQAGEG